MPIQRHSIANCIIPFVAVEVGVKQTEYGIPLSITSLSKPPESTSEQNRGRLLYTLLSIKRMNAIGRSIICTEGNPTPSLLQCAPTL